MTRRDAMILAGGAAARTLCAGPDVVDLLTVPEVAALLRLTPKGIYAMVESRRIPFVKISNRVRFLRSDVLAWLHENRVPSVGK